MADRSDTKGPVNFTIPTNGCSSCGYRIYKLINTDPIQAVCSSCGQPIDIVLPKGRER